MIAKARAGAPRCALAPVAMSECVETALALVQSALERACQHLVVEGNPSLETRADGRRVEQVLVNLLMIAAERGSSGSTIHLLVETGDGTVRVWVCDEGPGIGPGAREQNVSPPRHGSVDAPGGGHGLGSRLELVKTLIEREGGQAGIECSPGKGSSFWFTLPAAQPRRK